MSKKQKDLERIEEIKKNLEKKTTEKLLEWKNLGYLGEHGRKAIKLVLKERGIEN